MRIVYFSHALSSCWNHGNAHFQRGLLRELGQLGHDVVACEPVDGWSATNLRAEAGEAALRGFSSAYPDLHVERYRPDCDAAELIQGADLVVVHEWTEPALVARLGALRKRGGRFLLLFHDTHHRAVSAPDEMARFDLSGYDAVLAFGQSLAEVYRRRGWGRRAYVLHEAADTSMFRPLRDPDAPRSGLVWVGNWGDAERSEELVTYLLRPALGAGLPLDVYGVRYPAEALRLLKVHGTSYHGWIANIDVPPVFARHLATVHVPRRHYTATLPGIPTIRVFEALACGIPLLCAPWDDTEGLFVPGSDYLQARSESEMRDGLRAIRHDAGLRHALATAGLEHIRARHSCRHRARELVGIVEQLGAGSVQGAA